MSKQDVKLPLFRIFLLRLATFAGGSLFGMGLLVLAQVQLVKAIQTRVEEVGFLGRTVGRLTFSWRNLNEKISLAVGDVPRDWIDHSQTTGFVLVLGGILVGYLLPFVFRAWWWMKRT